MWKFGINLVCGVESLSRRRSANPTKAISITLKQSIIDHLDAELRYNQSRSKFISACIEKHIFHNTGIDAFTSKQLLFELLYRGVLNHKMFEMLENSISEDA